jgi:hypothetical protein
MFQQVSGLLGNLVQYCCRTQTSRRCRLAFAVAQVSGMHEGSGDLLRALQADWQLD